MQNVHSGTFFDLLPNERMDSIISYCGASYRFLNLTCKEFYFHCEKVASKKFSLLDTLVEFWYFTMKQADDLLEVNHFVEHQLTKVSKTYGGFVEHMKAAIVLQNQTLLNTLLRIHSGKQVSVVDCANLFTTIIQHCSFKLFDNHQETDTHFIRQFKRFINTNLILFQEQAVHYGVALHEHKIFGIQAPKTQFLLKKMLLEAIFCGQSDILYKYEKEFNEWMEYFVNNEEKVLKQEEFEPRKTKDIIKYVIPYITTKPKLVQFFQKHYPKWFRSELEQQFVMNSLKLSDAILDYILEILNYEVSFGNSYPGLALYKCNTKAVQYFHNNGYDYSIHKSDLSNWIRISKKDEVEILRILGWIPVTIQEYCNILLGGGYNCLLFVDSLVSQEILNQLPLKDHRVLGVFKDNYLFKIKQFDVLIPAITNGNLDQLLYLIQKGYKLEFDHIKHAFFQGNRKIIDYLLQSFTFTPKQYEELLTEVIKSKNLELFKYLFLGTDSVSQNHLFWLSTETFTRMIEYDCADFFEFLVRLFENDENKENNPSNENIIQTFSTQLNICFGYWCVYYQAIDCFWFLKDYVHFDYINLIGTALSTSIQDKLIPFFQAFLRKLDILHYKFTMETFKKLCFAFILSGNHQLLCIFLDKYKENTENLVYDSELLEYSIKKEENGILRTLLDYNFVISSTCYELAVSSKNMEALKILKSYDHKAERTTYYNSKSKKMKC